MSVNNIHIQQNTQLKIKQAIAALVKGEVVAIPTETVYGLAANGLKDEAVKKIFEIKNRPLNNPLILHFANKEAVLKYVDFEVESLRSDFDKLYQAFSPGPITYLLPKSELVPSLITAGSNRVAVRFPNHPITQMILSGLNFPLAAPSANPSGYISPSCAAHVQNQLGDKVEIIVDGGKCEGGIESTIIGWENNQPIIYRKGLITAADIESVIGIKPHYKIASKNQSQETQLDAPGMMTSHYAPRTKTILTQNIKQEIQKYPTHKIGVIKLMKDQEGILVNPTMYLSSNGDLTEIAQNLYATMHEMDTLKLDVILIEKAPDTGVGVAINDRLSRASV